MKRVGFKIAFFLGDFTWNDPISLYRFVNNRVFTEQFVSQKKNTPKPSAPQTVEKAVPKKTSKKELKNQAKKEPKKESRKERKMKTESADINAEGLQLGQTVTAV